MLQLKENHYQIVQQILNRYPYSFYAYGSRVKGTARKLSDLDICYQEEISEAVSFLIEEEFKESDLPFTVELVAWKNMRPVFQEMIKPDLTLISSPAKNC